MKVVTILGNGASRRNNAPAFYDGDMWVSNYGACEFALLPAIHTVGTVHREVAQLLIGARQWLVERKMKPCVKVWRILYPASRDPIQEVAKVELFKGFHPISTGPMLLYQAILEGYDRIDCYGFDFGGPGLYGGYRTSTEQPVLPQYPDWWLEQTQRVFRELKPRENTVHFFNGWYDCTPETIVRIAAWRQK